MKVKNIVFSGVMAAILGATGANAAVTVASQGYVDSRVGAVETNITNNYLTKEDATNTYLTETQVTQQITKVVGTSENGVLADVVANKTAIADLQSSKANAADVYSKTDADSTFATKDALSAVETTANAAATKTYVDTEFAKYTTTADLDSGFVSEDEMTAFKSANTAAINAKVDQSDYDTKVSALEAKDTELAGGISDLQTALAKKISAPAACETQDCVLSINKATGTIAWVPLTEPVENYLNN